MSDPNLPGTFPVEPALDLPALRRGVAPGEADASGRARAFSRVAAGMGLDAAELLAWAPTLLYVYDLEAGRSVFQNQPFSELLGYPPEAVDAMGGREWRLLMHGEEQGRFPAHLERLRGLAPGEAARFGYRMRHADGSWRWIESTDLRVPGRDGGAGRFVIGTAADITAHKAAADALAASEAKLRLLVEHAPVAVAIFDRRMTYLAASRQWRVNNRLAEDPVGRNHYELAPWLPERWRESHRRALAGEVVSVEEDTIDDGNGRSGWLRWAVRPWTDESGAVGGIALFTEDITRRKEAEEGVRRAEERFRLAADAAQALVYEFDLRAGASAVAVHGIERLVGADPRAGASFTREAWQARIHRDDLRAHEADIGRASLAGDHYRSRYRVRHDEGHWLDVEDTGMVVHDAGGQAIRLVGAIVDITERRRAERALQEEARRKDDFLAMLAHELRNPLAPIRTTAALLGTMPARGAVADPLVERCRAVIERQVAQMSRLLDDLLDVSRLSRGKIGLRRQRTPLAAVLEAAIETARPLLDQQGQTLDAALPEARLEVDADAARLTQVFANLLNNASKYSPRGSRVALTCRVDGRRIEVGVRDEGIGIAPEMLGSVFELFVQTHEARAHAPGGLGLGLSLVQHLVQMHGGRVRAESEGPGRGSTFIVTLPLRAAGVAGGAAGAASAAAPWNAPLPPRRVLVVDDNVDAADSVAMLLHGLGSEVRTVYEGAAALVEAERLRPEVVLLDLGMPGLDGYEVCRRLRQLPGGMALTIVALSGWAQNDDRRRSAMAGFDRHLMKPVAPEALLQLVREAGDMDSKDAG